MLNLQRFILEEGFGRYWIIVESRVWKEKWLKKDVKCIEIFTLLLIRLLLNLSYFFFSILYIINLHEYSCESLNKFTTLFQQVFLESWWIRAREICIDE